MDELLNPMITAACKECGVPEEKLSSKDRKYLEEVFLISKSMFIKKISRLEVNHD